MCSKQRSIPSFDRGRVAVVEGVRLYLWDLHEEGSVVAEDEREQKRPNSPQVNRKLPHRGAAANETRSAG